MIIADYAQFQTIIRDAGLADLLEFEGILNRAIIESYRSRVKAMAPKATSLRYSVSVDVNDAGRARYACDDLYLKVVHADQVIEIDVHTLSRTDGELLAIEDLGRECDDAFEAKMILAEYTGIQPLSAATFWDACLELATRTARVIELSGEIEL